MGVAAVLAEEVGGVAANEGEAGGDSPVLSEAWRVLRLSVDAAAVLADHGFEGDAAVDVDGVAGVRHQGACRSRGSGRSRRCVPMAGDHLAGVTRRRTTTRRPAAPVAARRARTRRTADWWK